jgi:acyl-coenzyme A thioesterase PaaI-like protein
MAQDPDDTMSDAKAAALVKGAAPFAYQQHLGIVLDATADHSVATLLARPDLCVAPGICRLGVVATLADCAAGMAALVTLKPAWTATMDLAVHALLPFADPHLCASATVLKRRRTGLVIEVGVTDGSGLQVATAIGSFADMPQQGESGLAFASRGVGGREAVPVVGTPAPIDEHVLVRTEGDDRFTLDIHDGVRNTSDALLGGAAALLMETAAERSVRARGRTSAVATGMEIRYLAPGRVGPIRATSTVLPRSDASVTLVRVQLVDRGAEDRLTAVATVSVRSAGS